MIGLPPVTCDRCGNASSLVEIEDDAERRSALPAGWSSLSLIVADPNVPQRTTELCAACTSVLGGFLNSAAYLWPPPLPGDRTDVA